MNNEALINKYRPKTLDDIYGNDAVVTAINDLLDSDNALPPIILGGATGCGKTTLARIIYNELSAETLGVGLVEVNCSDMNKIDDVREIAMDMNGGSMFHKTRVFILDEFHRTTTASQNLLLKTLEEPKQQIVPIIATTEPNKVAKAIQSRAVILTLKPLSYRDMKDYILDIMEKEELEPFDDRIIKQIYKASEGSPRNALTYIASYGKFSDEERRVLVIEGVVSDETQARHVPLIYKAKKWRDVVPVIQDHRGAGIQNSAFDSLRISCIHYCATILCNGEDERALTIVEAMKEPFDEKAPLGSLISALHFIVTGE